jgi:two-component system, OmpR family, sensor histidine kinase QseC
MKRYLHYFGPSLIRRVVIAILLAFALCWLTLAVYNYWMLANPRLLDRQLLVQGQSVMSMLEPLATDSEAKVLVAVMSAGSNQDSEHDTQTVLFQLNDRQGRRIYFSPEGRNAVLKASPYQLSNAEVNGKKYRVFRGLTSRWELIVAVQLLNTTNILGQSILEMTIQMLIALPIMVCTTWLVVSRGLRPLRELSNLIANKNKDDLSPLHFASPYAELKPLSAALDRLLNQLRGKIAREHAFVQDAAHELRTPMAVISAQAHVLTLANTPAARLAAEQNLELAIGRASHLIAQLLEMSHLDNDRLTTTDTMDLVTLLQQELARLAPAAMARQIELSLDAPDVLLSDLDANALQSIVQNLLNNAILYVHTGGQVEVELHQTAQAIILSVADNGPGIAEQDRERVFERFYRGAGHDVAGTGLGLAIVAQAALRLNAQIELSTGLFGQGCRFTVVIPCSNSGLLVALVP